MSKLIIGTKAKRFDLVRLRSERKQNALVWSEFFCIKSSSFPFWPKSSGTKRTNLIWSRNCLRRSGTFLCNKKTYRSKQKVLISFPYYLLVTCRGVSWTPCRRVVDTAGVVVVGHLHLVVVHLLFVCSVASHLSVGYLSYSISSCLLSGLFQAPFEAILGCCLLTGFRQPVPFFHRSH